MVVALAFTALGVPQTLSGSVEATTIEGAKQIISIGPVASQEAIKLIGDNGGGFFNANSAHPFENPSVWSNILENWSQLVLPVGLVFAFGRMVGDPKQGRALLAAMAVVFLVALVVFYWSETRGNPELTALGVDPALGNMEGKDVRFGQAGAALFVDATTGTGTGASNAVLEFYDFRSLEWSRCSISFSAAFRPVASAPASTAYCCWFSSPPLSAH